MRTANIFILSITTLCTILLMLIPDVTYAKIVSYTIVRHDLNFSVTIEYENFDEKEFRALPGSVEVLDLTLTYRPFTHHQFFGNQPVDLDIDMVQGVFGAAIGDLASTKHDLKARSAIQKEHDLKARSAIQINFNDRTRISTSRGIQYSTATLLGFHLPFIRLTDNGHIYIHGYPISKKYKIIKKNSPYIFPVGRVLRDCDIALRIGEIPWL